MTTWGCESGIELFEDEMFTDMRYGEGCDWPVLMPWLEYDEAWIYENFGYGAMGSNIEDTPLDYMNPDLYVFDPDKYITVDWHHLGPSEMDYDYFEKLYSYRRPFKEAHKYLLALMDELKRTGGELGEKTRWVTALVLQTSPARRHRHIGIRLIEDVYNRKYPPSPTMIFHMTLARVRDGEYALAMDYMLQSRILYPGYGRNVALEDFLKRKIKERAWERKRWAMLHILTVGVVFLFGGRTAWLHWSRRW